MDSVEDWRDNAAIWKRNTHSIFEQNRAESLLKLNWRYWHMMNVLESCNAFHVTDEHDWHFLGAKRIMVWMRRGSWKVNSRLLQTYAVKSNIKLRWSRIGRVKIRKFDQPAMGLIEAIESFRCFSFSASSRPITLARRVHSFAFSWRLLRASSMEYFTSSLGFFMDDLKWLWSNRSKIEKKIESSNVPHFKLSTFYILHFTNYFPTFLHFFKSLSELVLNPLAVLVFS